MTLDINYPQIRLFQSLFDLFDEPPKLTFVSALFTSIELCEQAIEHLAKSPGFNRHADHSFSHTLIYRTWFDLFLT